MPTVGLEPTTLRLKSDALPTDLAGLVECWPLRWPYYIHVLPIPTYTVLYGSVRGSYQTIWGPPLPNVTRHSGWWPHTLIGHYTNFWPLLIWTLLPNLTFYLIVQGFHRTIATGAACQQRTLTHSGHLVLSHLGFAFVPSNRNHTTYLWRLPNMTYLPKFTLPNCRGFNRIFATGVACQQGTLTPPDTWSCPTLGLACVLMSRPISPELVLSPDFWISNIPRYFSFAYKYENDDKDRNLHYFLSCKYTVLCYIFAYIYIVQIAKRRTSPVLAFNMEIPDQVECLVVVTYWKQAQNLCVSLQFVQYIVTQNSTFTRQIRCPSSFSY